MKAYPYSDDSSVLIVYKDHGSSNETEVENGGTIPIFAVGTSPYREVIITVTDLLGGTSAYYVYIACTPIEPNVSPFAEQPEEEDDVPSPDISG